MEFDFRDMDHGRIIGCVIPRLVLFWSLRLRHSLRVVCMGYARVIGFSTPWMRCPCLRAASLIAAGVIRQRYLWVTKCFVRYHAFHLYVEPSKYPRLH